MNDSEIIRKAVELADGWIDERSTNFWKREVTDDGKQFNVLGSAYENAYQPALDALAAQLVRQVDLIDDVELVSRWYGTDLNKRNEIGCYLTAMSCSSENMDRTMNTLLAIVESGVLTDTSAKGSSD